MNYSIYSLKTLFNTHVGSGQSSYGIVDNIVQKDYLNAYPCIHSTSLKGALREWVEVALNKKNEAKSIFGSENNTQNGGNSNQKSESGSHHFFQASMLSFPMRSDKVQYFNVTCPKIVKDFKSQLNVFRINRLDKKLQTLIDLAPVANSPKSVKGVANAIVELHTIRTQNQTITLCTEIETLFGANLVVMNDNDFDKLIKKLPIITRNHLENGQSTNLFYEEVVPRETHFAFLIGTNTTGPNTFNSIKDENKLVQIGANATVGYGFCKLQQITT